MYNWYESLSLIKSIHQLQNLKDQILTTNVWLEHVSVKLYKGNFSKFWLLSRLRVKRSRHNRSWINNFRNGRTINSSGNPWNTEVSLNSTCPASIYGCPTLYFITSTWYCVLQYLFISFTIIAIRKYKRDVLQIAFLGFFTFHSNILALKIYKRINSKQRALFSVRTESTAWQQWRRPFCITPGKYFGLPRQFLNLPAK